MENYAYNLIDGIKSKRNDVDFTLLVFDDQFSFKDKFINKLKCKYIILPNFKKHPLRFYKTIVNLNKQLNANDIIQINTCSFRNFLLFKACSKLGCKKIIVSHYSKINGGFGLIHKINRRLFSKKFINVAVSETAGKFMFCSNFQIIQNGIKSELFEYKSDLRNKIRKQYKIEENTFLIGQVGRISKDKNQFFALKVFEKLLIRCPNSKIMFVGKGNNHALERFLCKKGLDKNVIFTGSQKNVGEFYSAFDCLILPSKNEAAALVLFEGLSNGLPCVCSKNVPSIQNYINNDYLYYNSLNVEDWVNTLIRIKNGKNVRNNLISTTVFEYKNFIDNYFKLYF